MSTYNLAFYHAAAPMEPDQRAGLQTSMKIAIAVYDVHCIHYHTAPVGEGIDTLSQDLRALLAPPRVDLLHARK